MKIKDVLDRDKVPESMAQKIKDLRQQRGMTLEQVANIVGVGKSTVRKWETGMIANMKRDKIAALAQALGTTPAYLMGWKEETKEETNSPDQIILTEGEEMLLKLFRQIPEENRAMVLEMIRAAVNTQG
jgi:transcriptional regulator with XRE-family HTH domain